MSNSADMTAQRTAPSMSTTARLSAGSCSGFPSAAHISVAIACRPVPGPTARPAAPRTRLQQSWPRDDLLGHGELERSGVQSETFGRSCSQRTLLVGVSWRLTNTYLMAGVDRGSRYLAANPSPRMAVIAELMLSHPAGRGTSHRYQTQ